MITTNVDKAIHLLDEKGKVDVKEIAKTLGTKQDSIDLILSYLEEEGLVELKYGVFHTIASLKKKKEEKKAFGKVKKIEEELPEELPEEGEKKPAVEKAVKPELMPKHIPKQIVKPKPIEKPKLVEIPKPAPAEVPKSVPEIKKPVEKLEPEVPKSRSEASRKLKKAEEGIIPRFDEAKGAKTEKRSARIANMMIKLLEKSPHLTKEEKPHAEKVLRDILNLAKANKIYKQKTAVTAEFTLCSLLFTTRLLLDDYRERGGIETAKKIYSTYHLIRKSALESDKARLKYYRNQISSIYGIILNNIYPKLKEIEKKEKEEKEKSRLAAEKQRQAKALKQPEKLEPEVPKIGTRGSKFTEQSSAKSRSEASRKPMLKAKPLKMVKLKPAEKLEPEVPKSRSEASRISKPVEIPKPMQLIPNFDSSKGSEDEQNAARLANTMISLLEKFYSLPKDNRPNAVILLNDLLKLAKQNNLYSQKNTMSAEFILGSLLISVNTLLSEHEESMNMRISNRINSTYHLMREVAMEIDMERIKYYKELINDVYQSSMESSFLDTGAK